MYSLIRKRLPLARNLLYASAYRGASLMRKRFLLGPYAGPMPMGTSLMSVKAFWELLSPERPEPGLSPLSLLLGSKTEIFGARAGRQRSGSKR